MTANYYPKVAYQIGDRYRVGTETLSSDELDAYFAPYLARGLGCAVCAAGPNSPMRYRDGQG